MSGKGKRIREHRHVNMIQYRRNNYSTRQRRMKTQM